MLFYQHRANSIFKFLSDYVHLTTTPLGPELDKLAQEFSDTYKDDFDDSINYNDVFSHAGHLPSDFIIRLVDAV